MSSSLPIGVLGPFGPAQLACLRSWRRAGYRTAFFQLGGRCIPPRLRRLTDEYHFYPETMQLEEVLGQVSRECARGKVAGLTTLAEALALELHAQHRDGRFATTELLLNDPEVYGTLESKVRQADLAAQAGLPLMPTFVLDTFSERLDAPGPLVLRPDVERTVQPAFKVQLVDNAEQALAIARAMTAPEGRLIVQSFVAGPNLIIHAARARDGSWDHHEAFYTEIKSGGLAVALRPYPLPAGLLAACRRFEQAIGLRGVFHYDFILDENSGEAYFLEVNPRLGGTTGKVSAAVGVGTPFLLFTGFAVWMFAGSRKRPGETPIGRFVGHVADVIDRVRKRLQPRSRIRA